MDYKLTKNTRSVTLRTPVDNPALKTLVYKALWGYASQTGLGYDEALRMSPKELQARIKASPRYANLTGILEAVELAVGILEELI